MKIITLLENTVCRDDVSCEHGLSLYIETKKHKILFDTGQSDLFVQNANTLGVNLDSIDMVILSHGHYDHGGGLPAFLQINHHAKVYMHQDACSPHFNGTEKNIGILTSLKDHPQVTIIKQDEYYLDDGYILYTCNDRHKKYPINSYGLMKKVGTSFVPDDFVHEQYLEIIEDDQKVLISGCSHKGILNIMDWFHPDVLVGGFHFKKLDPSNHEDQKTLQAAAQELNTYPCMYYTAHCTGVKQYEYLKGYMKDKLEYLSTGSILTL